MKQSLVGSISALALALVASAGIAGAQTRTSQQAAVCKDGTQVAEVRLCNFRGGVDAQATQELRTYGTYGRSRTNGQYGQYPQQQRDGSWKVNGQQNGSWKVNGGRASNGRNDGRYGQTTGQYGQYPQQQNGRYDARNDRRDDDDDRYDSRRDDDRGRGKQHHDRGKHKGWDKQRSNRDRDDRD